MSELQGIFHWNYAELTDYEINIRFVPFFVIDIFIHLLV
jgi:hypothetical protein